MAAPTRGTRASPGPAHSCEDALTEPDQGGRLPGPLLATTTSAPQRLRHQSAAGDRRDGSEGDRHRSGHDELVRRGDGGRQAKVIENAEGMRTTPSIVAFAKDGEVLVGMPAKRQAMTNPENTIFAIKRLIGRRYDDPMVREGQGARALQDRPRRQRRCLGRGAGQEVQPEPDQRLHPDQDEGDRRGLSRREGDRGGRSPCRPTSTIASARRPRTPARSPASRCCASSTSRPRRRWPTASEKKGQGKIAVYDFGGGTFDISILEIGDGVFEVKATNGDTFLGGEDFDKRIIDWLADEFKKEQGIDLRKRPAGAAAPQGGGGEGQDRAVLDARRPRSTCRSSPPTSTGRSTCRSSSPAPSSKALVDDLIQRTIAPCETALKDAGLSAKDIEEVILVGGQTRMPKIQETVQSSSARSRTRASTRTRWSRSAPRSRAACSRATSRTCCCSTSRRSRSASRRSAA